MITQNRWQHILGVARKAKVLAEKLKPDNAQYAEDMFLLGVMHDLGYEFMESNASHAAVGGKILKRNNYQYWQEVALHGDETVENMSDELFILNCADMMTGPNGEDFTFEERLEEIAGRFGKDTAPYQKCVIEVQKLKADERYKRLK
ncbi:MAG: HDOD domain-containing protein [Alphaproteobacteria bacterium]|nr:HDOD domain-containing protein [Alphaproteobacteria bacterium]